jgi:Fe-S cluster assembly protein SufB
MTTVGNRPPEPVSGTDAVRMGETVLREALSHDDVDAIATIAGDSPWLREWRHEALESLATRVWPAWTGGLTGLNLSAQPYVPLQPVAHETIALPNAARRAGVIAEALTVATREHEPIVRALMGSLVPAHDNLFAALASAVWTRGWFVHVPAGVTVEDPIVLPVRGTDGDAPAGRFARTLIVVEEGASVPIVDDASTPGDFPAPMSAAVTEVLVRRGGRCRCSAVQRWPRHVFAFATRRAAAESESVVRWDDIHLGARLTMQYPSVYLRGVGATGEIISVAVARSGAHQDVGAKLLFEGPRGHGRVRARMVALPGGRTTFRPLVRVAAGASEADSDVRGMALVCGPDARSDTHPFTDIDEPGARVRHAVSEHGIDERRVAELEQTGLQRSEAVANVAAEFLQPLTDELIPEHARLVGEALR